MIIKTDLKKIHDELTERQKRNAMKDGEICWNCRKEAAQGNGLCPECDSIRSDVEEDRKHE